MTVIFSLATCLHAAPTQRNLFSELLGKSDAAIAAKIDAGWQQLFYGDDQTQRVYYPVGTDAAYIADVASHDVRSEGMSYGMMIAVQMNRREEFDRLWRWAKTHMLHTEGPRRGYFAWHCSLDGRPLDPGSASDGEEWFATALLFAAHRWGSGADGLSGRANRPGEPDRAAPQQPGSGGRPDRHLYPMAVGTTTTTLQPRLGGDASPYRSVIDYAADARALLHEMLHKPRGEITAIFDRERRLVVFAPSLDGSQLTDPSYHLPAFYELWARWSDEADRPFWRSAAAESRAFFRRAAHPRTGLMPEYAHFDGRPYVATTYGEGKGDFRFDAWRTLANVALDHAWFAADPWQVEQSNRVLRFLRSHLPDVPNQFSLDGKPLSTDVSTGLFAMAAVAGLAADPKLARPFVKRLWDAPIPAGQWRYYDGLLYQLALLQVSGNFRIHEAAAIPR